MITLVAVLLAGTAAPAFADPLDFVVQQVCVDAGDAPLPGDPAHCPNRRLLRVGEAVPYRRVDAGNWQALYAYPVDSPGGERRAVIEKVFGGNDPSGSFGDLGSRSGYDLLQADVDYVSGIRTSDPGGGDQIFWRTADCARANGWIFFPVGLRPGERGEIQSTLKITKGPSIDCPRDQLRNIAPDDTVWERPLEPVRYTSGKRLDSIVSEHFAYGDPDDPAHDDDSMEKFYFTREYGFSRWEAWETPVGCARRAAREGTDVAVTCRPSPREICNGDNQATFFGKPYLRLDCRDSTLPGRRRRPALQPARQRCGAGRCRAAATCSPTAPFSRASAAGRPRPPAVPRHEPRGNNAVLALAPQGRLSQAFDIPADVQGVGRPARLRWGVSLAPDAVGAHARLTLTLEHEGGAPTILDQAVRLDDGPHKAVHFDAPMPVAGGRLVRGRFSLVLDGTAGARVDDAYVAVVAQPMP